MEYGHRKSDAELKQKFNELCSEAAKGEEYLWDIFAAIQVVTATIMLAVDALRVLIADGEDFLGIAADLARTVNFKLYAEIPGCIPIENGFGAVTVIVNGAVSEQVTAAFAIGGVFFIVQIKNAVKGQHCPAAFAGRIVSVKASLAKRMIRRPRILFDPNPCAAVRADKSFLVQTGFA